MISSVYDPDYSQLRNRVIVRGGYELSTSFTETFRADGSQRIFPLSWKPHNVSNLTVGGVNKTYAVEFLNDDDGTYNYFWNYSEKHLKSSDFITNPEPTPAAGTEIALTYQFEVPILVQVDDDQSQRAVGALEGGSGIYETIIKDTSILSRADARNRGISEIQSFGNPLINGHFVTYNEGFQSGQTINMDVSDYSRYTGDYVVQHVVISHRAPGLIEYKVQFSTTLYELKDLIIKLLRDNKRIEIRQDETIDILKTVRENVAISELITLTIVSVGTQWDNVRWDRFVWQ